jgi:hypothetical protein
MTETTIVKIFDNKTLLAIFLLCIGVALVAYGHSQAYFHHGPRSFEIEGATRSPFATAIGFAFIAMGTFLLGLRYFALEKDKRKFVLLVGMCIAIALVLILILGCSDKDSESETTWLQTQGLLYHEWEELPPELLAWHYDQEACGTFPNGLKVDSAKWRFTSEKGQCCFAEWEAEVKFSWNGQETLSGVICCSLLDANEYRISEDGDDYSVIERIDLEAVANKIKRERVEEQDPQYRSKEFDRVRKELQKLQDRRGDEEEIFMPPQSKEIYTFRLSGRVSHFLEVGWEPRQLATAGKKLQLGFRELYEWER